MNRSFIRVVLIIICMKILFVGSDFWGDDDLRSEGGSSCIEVPGSG